MDIAYAVTDMADTNVLLMMIDFKKEILAAHFKLRMLKESERYNSDKKSCLTGGMSMNEIREKMMMLIKLDIILKEEKYANLKAKYT